MFIFFLSQNEGAFFKVFEVRVPEHSEATEPEGRRAILFSSLAASLFEVRLARSPPDF